MAQIQTKVKMFSLASSLLGKDNPETGKNVQKISSMTTICRPLFPLLYQHGKNDVMKKTKTRE